MLDTFEGTILSGLQVIFVEFGGLGIYCISRVSLPRISSSTGWMRQNDNNWMNYELAFAND